MSKSVLESLHIAKVTQEPKEISIGAQKSEMFLGFSHFFEKVRVAVEVGEGSGVTMEEEACEHRDPLCHYHQQNVGQCADQVKCYDDCKKMCEAKKSSFEELLRSLSPWPPQENVPSEENKQEFEGMDKCEDGCHDVQASIRA